MTKAERSALYQEHQSKRAAYIDLNLADLKSEQAARAQAPIFTCYTALEVAETPPSTMVVHDPGDAQRVKCTSTTHDQHDPGQVKALEGRDGTNRKKIGAKLIENDNKREIAVDIAVDTANRHERDAIKQAKDEDADAAMAMELELEANYYRTDEDD